MGIPRAVVTRRVIFKDLSAAKKSVRYTLLEPSAFDIEGPEPSCCGNCGRLRYMNNSCPIVGSVQRNGVCMRWMEIKE